MHDEESLKRLFPRASRSFLEANLGLRPKVPKPDTRKTLARKVRREAESDARPVVSIVVFRVRRLDKENLYGSTKPLTDCLCQVGLIPGDAEDQIDLQVTQQRVPHYADQHTELRIDY